MNSRTEQLMEEEQMDYNSKKNLEIKNLLVVDNVHTNITNLVNLILEQQKERDYDFDIKNFYFYPEISSEHGNIDFTHCEEKYAQIDLLEDSLDRMNRGHELYIELSNFIEFLKKDHKEERVEIEEWWTVSRQLYEMLEAKEEVVLEYGPTIVWGRKKNDCRMIADGVISEIAEDMKILEGQQNEWVVK